MPKNLYLCKVRWVENTIYETLSFKYARQYTNLGS